MHHFLMHWHWLLMASGVAAGLAKSLFGVVAPGQPRSYIADTALPAGVAVIAGALPNSVKLPTGANQRALGVTAVAALNAGDPVTLVEVGEVTAIADAAITRNAWVMINAVTGQLAPIGAVAGTNYETVGMALEAAAAQGDEFLLLVQQSRSQG
jgi:hypothetical protein